MKPSSTLSVPAAITAGSGLSSTFAAGLRLGLSSAFAAVSTLLAAAGLVLPSAAAGLALPSTFAAGSMLLFVAVSPCHATLGDTGSLRGSDSPTDSDASAASRG
ncbi:hypothetical protein SEVIR_8G217750v4 [Setaria viridis]